jgi:hypothetical protein
MSRIVLNRAVAGFGALLVLASGGIHLDRYLAEYDSGDIGTAFLVQIGLCALFAIWLVARPHPIAALGALALMLGTIGLLLWTREHTLFDFQSDEFGFWETASVVVEGAAAFVLVGALGTAHPNPPGLARFLGLVSVFHPANGTQECDMGVSSRRPTGRRRGGASTRPYVGTRRDRSGRDHRSPARPRR